MSLGEPRVVDTDWGVPPDWSKFYKSVPDAGPLLHVNREARAEALKIGIIGVPDVLRKSTIYVNPNKDIFYFGPLHEVWLEPRGRFALPIRDLQETSYLDDIPVKQVLFSLLPIDLLFYDRQSSRFPFEDIGAWTAILHGSKCEIIKIALWKVEYNQRVREGRLSVSDLIDLYEEPDRDFSITQVALARILVEDMQRFLHAIKIGCPYVALPEIRLVEVKH